MKQDNRKREFFSFFQKFKRSRKDANVSPYAINIPPPPPPPIGLLGIT
jgi:hypothetical protein